MTKEGKGTHVGRLAVELHELVDVELGRLQDLHLADEDVLEGEDALGGLLDLLADHLWRKLPDETLEVDAGHFTGHDLEHLLADGTDLGGLGIGGLADLVRPALGECDGEQAHEVPVSRLHVNVRLDERLPLADERAQFVGGEAHAVEVEESVLPLDFVHPQLDFAERLLLVLAKICDGELDDAPADRVGSVFCR